MEMRLEIQKLQAQCQMGQQALQDQDQRAAKAEALHARLKGQMEEILNVSSNFELYHQQLFSGFRPDQECLHSSPAKIQSGTALPQISYLHSFQAPAVTRKG